MSDTTEPPAPFDPSEYTARELHLARQFLQLLRCCHAAADIEMALNLTGDRLALLWHRRPEQRLAFSTGPVTYTSSCDHDNTSTLLTLDKEAPPAQESQADSLPKPDAIVEPPPDDEDEQP